MCEMVCCVPEVSVSGGNSFIGNSENYQQATDPSHSRCFMQMYYWWNASHLGTYNEVKINDPSLF